MRRRFTGIDINGWRDLAARDWDLDDLDRGASDTHVLDGGIGTVAVNRAADSAEKWIGGPQAAMAPHGRGRGWGAVGGAERRVSLANSCEVPLSAVGAFHGRAYAAAVEALSRGSQQVILGVPDVPSFGEAAQGQILNLFKGSELRTRLLWRPVAAFLHAMQAELIKGSDEGRTFRFLIHGGTGFEVQRLRLRRDGDRTDHLAPERQGPGDLILPDLGLRGLWKVVDERVTQTNAVLQDNPSEKSRLGMGILLGTARGGDREILRHDNTNWFEVTAPEIEARDLFGQHDVDLPQDHRASEAAATFLLTPLAPRWKAALHERLSAAIPNLHVLEWDSLARGCLLAGRLIDRGLPHYFDKLTPIALAVMSEATAEPEFTDLIGSEATLPANREYVSKPFDTLKWLARKKDVAFYVLKGSDEVRHWRVALDDAPDRDVPIELRLRQTPGQSWARLSLTSPEWEPLRRAPILLDWAALDPVPETPEEILDQLRTPPPTIPNRIVESAHIDVWNGSDRIFSLIQALDNHERRRIRDKSAIAHLIARGPPDPASKVRMWAIGTDGEFPPSLPAKERQCLAQLLRDCEAEILGASLKKPLRNNDALRIATWVFTLCPEGIQEAIVAALEADQRGRPHPLLEGGFGRRKVLIQGAGRAVGGEERLKRLISVLSSGSPNNDKLSALAMILSRRREAPSALTEEIATHLAEVLSQELRYLLNLRSFKVRFKNTVSALAGLFRYREVSRYALLATRDPVARRLLGQVELIRRQLEQEAAYIYHRDEKIAILNSIEAYLEGGGDPDILIRIETLDEDGEETD